MKKNRFVKIATAMTVLSLMTLCVVGTTFAKYTTGSNAEDTARVAKWGVEVSTSGTLFGKAYATNGTTNSDEIVAWTNSYVNAASAVSVDGDSIVAPGTKNSTGIQIKIAGQPEVNFKTTATSTAVSDIYLAAGTYATMVEAYGLNAASDVSGYYTLASGTYTKVTSSTYVAGTTYYVAKDSVTIGENGYYPLAWTGTLVANNSHANHTDANLSGTWTSTFDSLQAAVTYLTTDINNKSYAANTSVSLTYTLTWAWAFDGNNAADTILGNIMAGAKVVKVTGTTVADVVENTDYKLSVGCTINVGAEQID